MLHASPDAPNRHTGLIVHGTGLRALFVQKGRAPCPTSAVMVEVTAAGAADRASGPDLFCSPELDDPRLAACRLT